MIANAVPPALSATVISAILEKGVKKGVRDNA
jgi:hypothetical protein